GGLLTASQGYDFRTVVTQALRTLAGALAQAGDWAWNSMLKPIAESLLNKATTAVTSLWDTAKKKLAAAVTGVISGVTGTVNAGVKKVTDFVGYNLCNGGCLAGWIPYVTCWKARSTCD